MPSLVKELILKELQAQFESSPYAFISNFDKISVADLSDFRRTVEKVSKRSVLVKHAVVKKVFAKQNTQEAEKFLKGSVLVTFGDKDPQLISKAIIDFIKTNQKIVSSGVIFENKVYDQTFVRQLASLPSRQELLTQTVVRIKSPITGLVMTLGQVVRGVVVALNEIKKLKEAQPQTA